MSDQLGRRNADEARRQATLGHKRVAGSSRNSPHRAGDFHILRQVEIVSAGLPGSLGNRDIAVIRQAGNDGIHGVVRQVPCQRGRVGRIEGKGGQIGGGMGMHHGLGCGAVDVAQLNLVTTGFCKQSRNECADLAGPQNQYSMHGIVPWKKARILRHRADSIKCMRSPETTSWHSASWQSKPAQQQPVYTDPKALERAVAHLSRLPPIVVSWEVEALRERLAAAQRGQAFLLQGGDCAETFADCESDQIAKKLKILLQMSIVLLHGLKKPIIRVGRMAGQYAKPRSADNETRNGVTLPAYRGDLVNRPEFEAAARAADPELLLRGYERAALTLNFVRALVDGGFADLHHPEYWDLGFVKHAPLKDAYQRIVNSIADALDFFEGMSGTSVHEARLVSFYASHEGLHLLYEQAQTRFIPRQNRWYNLSTHFPWIGMRTAQLDGAHVEYFRGISNPVAIKIGSAMDTNWLQGLVTTLNPQNQPGRLTLIHRFGAKDVENSLPRAIEAVRATGHSVLWVCDPMHGNTETSTGGLKTRRFENILKELDLAFRIHADMGSHLGGVHIELTGDDVTECTGGARGLTDGDLQRAYRSQVDPRLNHEQALELAMLIAERSQSRRADRLASRQT